MIYTLQCSSPVGNIVMAERGGELVGVWLEGQKYFLSSIKEECVPRSSPVLRQTQLWLERYFDGDSPSPEELELAPGGSEFRKIVWQLLCRIPYGELTTYGQLAKEAATLLGREQMSAQAVGGAVGHNPISIIIPCHRVIGTDGSLTGYAGGIDKKRWLLEHEGANIE